jgi:hypothetical protein
MAVPNNAITKTVRIARLFTLSSERLICEWLLAPTHLAIFYFAEKSCIGGMFLAQALQPFPDWEAPSNQGSIVVNAGARGARSPELQIEIEEEDRTRRAAPTGHDRNHVAKEMGSRKTKATLKRAGTTYRAATAPPIKAIASAETNARERRPMASLMFTGQPLQPRAPAPCGRGSSQMPLLAAAGAKFRSRP